MFGLTSVFPAFNLFYISTFAFTFEMSETKHVARKEIFSKDAERVMQEYLELSEKQALKQALKLARNVDGPIKQRCDF